MKLFIILVVLPAFFINNGYAQLWQDRCINPHGLEGTCINIRRCQPLLNLLLTQSQVPSAMQFLRNAQCGFAGSDPRVCCVMENQNTYPNQYPNPNPVNQYPKQNPIVPYPNQEPINQYPKQNPVVPYPNQEPINPYPNQNPIIPYPKQNPIIPYPNQEPVVPYPNRQTVPPIRPTEPSVINKKFDARTLLPSDCGRELIFRIIGGEAVALDEYPWMVLLEYQKPTGNSTACGGVLISNRYVLTAAHCVKGKDLPKTWTLSGVRLGEYDTDTNPDCINDGGNTRACAPPVKIVEIEQKITHQNYDPLSKTQLNDIALIRLREEVVFGDFIKPVCLPSSSVVPERLIVAGWGKTENRSDSNVKLKVQIPLSNREQCEDRYGKAGVQLQSSQICAGGEKGKDSCRGDSGGPLMAAEKNAIGSRWSVIGLVSFGPSPCGMSGWPAIYTKVSDYTSWILEHMRP